MKDDLSIGGALVQPRLNTITVRGRAARLEPKIMEVLVCLARHGGEVVSRDDLIREVWGDTFVTDGVLTRSIAELRKVFDDDVREPRVIETIAKQGYRLIASVEPPNQDAPAPAVAPRSRRAWLWVGAAAAAAAALALSWRFGADSRALQFQAVRLTVPLGAESLASSSWQQNRKNADGTGEAERLVTRDAFLSPMSCSPDGKYLVFVQGFVQGFVQQDLYLVNLEGEPKPTELAAGAGKGQGMVSPDGRWLAYVSTESGRTEVYVQGFPRPGGKWQVSTGGGREPLWSRDGRELFYRTLDGAIVAVPIAPGPTFRHGNPELLVRPGFRTGGRANYDVTPRGDRFLVIVNPDASATRQIHVVIDWVRELQSRLRAKS